MPADMEKFAEMKSGGAGNRAHEDRPKCCVA